MAEVSFIEIIKKYLVDLLVERELPVGAKPGLGFSPTSIG